MTTVEDSGSAAGPDSGPAAGPDTGAAAGSAAAAEARAYRSHDRLADGEPPRRADAVVIGAGIIGLAAADQLAERGLSVCVLDRSDAGSAQSARSWGFIRQQGRAAEELPLMIDSNRQWQELESRLGCDMEWRQGGNLRLTDSPDRAEDYRRWIELAGSYGLDSRLAQPEEVQRILPGFSGSYHTAIFTPSDGQVNPVKAVNGYLHALGDRGVQVLQNCAVRSIVTAGHRVVGVLTEDGFIGSSCVVLAAGVGSKALLRGIGVELPLHFVGQTVALTEPVPKLTDACVWTGEIGFRQARSGGVVLSSGGRGDVKVDLDSLTSLVSPRQLSQALPMYWKNREYLRVRPREVVGALRTRRRDTLLESDAIYDDVDNSLEVLSRYFPGFAGKVALAWAGTIDGTPDALPVIESLRDPSGLVVATGMSGHGFGIAPAVGAAIADLVSGTTPKHDLRGFRLHRFRDGDAKTPQHLL